MDEDRRRELTALMSRFDAGDQSVTLDVYDDACEELAEAGLL